MKSSVIFVTLLVSRIACLSLDEIHSSSQTFKSLSHNNRDKSLRNAIDTIHKRRQEYSQFYGPFSLPLKYYESLVDINIKPQQVVDGLLGQNQIDPEYLDESLKKDLFSRELVQKLSQLLESDEKQSDVGHRIYNRINRKRKRSTSKENSKINGNNDRKHLKNVKNVSQHKNNSHKSLTKRKSGRRVLNDHFNIEENHQNVINKDMKSINSFKPFKLKVANNRKVKNALKSKEIKKKIKKRTTELSVTPDIAVDRNSTTNDTHIPTKELKTTDKSVISELNDILSDDYKSDKNQKKKLNPNVEKKSENLNSLDNKSQMKNNQSIRKMSKRNDPKIDSIANKFDDNNNEMSDDIIVYPTIDKTETKEVQTNTDLNDWLRREFYENMAKTLATMRKKRSQDYLKDENDVINAIEESETIGDNIIAIDGNDEDRDNINDEEFRNFNQLSDDSDNDYVIAALDDDMKDKVYANDENDDNEADSDDNNHSLDWNNFEEKSETVKTKRSIPSYFGELEDINESNEIDSKRFTGVYQKLESIEDSLLNEALDLIRETAAKGLQNEVNTNKIENRLDAAYDIEDMRTALDDLENTFNKISGESDNEINDNYEIKSIPKVYNDEDQINRHKKDNLFDDSVSESDSKCLELELLSTDCSSLADLLPSDEIRYSFSESCNWHQICYSCGEIYGLLSSDCDAGFLEANRLSCAGSPSCEAFARLVLVPLRQSRVFYKSSVPQTCYRNQCIRDFLFDSQRNKR